MYHSQRDPLHRMSYKSKKMHIPRELEERRLQKAFLRYHDSKGWPALREELKRLGRQDLIGSGPDALIPAEENTTNKRVQRPGFKKGGKPSGHAKSAGPRRRK